MTKFPHVAGVLLLLASCPVVQAQVLRSRIEIEAEPVEPPARYGPVVRFVISERPYLVREILASPGRRRLYGGGEHALAVRPMDLRIYLTMKAASLEEGAPHLGSPGSRAPYFSFAESYSQGEIVPALEAYIDEPPPEGRDGSSVIQAILYTRDAAWVEIPGRGPDLRLRPATLADAGAPSRATAETVLSARYEPALGGELTYISRESRDPRWVRFPVAPPADRSVSDRIIDAQLSMFLTALSSPGTVASVHQAVPVREAGGSRTGPRSSLELMGRASHPDAAWWNGNFWWNRSGPPPAGAPGYVVIPQNASLISRTWAFQESAEPDIIRSGLSFSLDRVDAQGLATGTFHVFRLVTQGDRRFPDAQGLSPEELHVWRHLLGAAVREGAYAKGVEETRLRTVSGSFSLADRRTGIQLLLRGNWGWTWQGGLAADSVVLAMGMNRLFTGVRSVYDPVLREYRPVREYDARNSQWALTRSFTGYSLVLLPPVESLGVPSSVRRIDDWSRETLMLVLARHTRGVAVSGAASVEPYGSTFAFTPQSRLVAFPLVAPRPPATYVVAHQTTRGR